MPAKFCLNHVIKENMWLIWVNLTQGIVQDYFLDKKAHVRSVKIGLFAQFTLKIFFSYLWEVDGFR